MDVDPKPLDQTPNTTTEPAQPISDVVSPLTNSMPSSTSNQSMADALKEQPTSTSTDPISSSSVVSTPTVATKKSRRGIIGGIVIVSILIIAGLAWYVFYGVSTPKKVSNASATPSSAQATVTPATTATNGATITSAVDSLTTSTTGESTAASTDDSSSATDASTTAGNVGDSVNANNF